MADQSKWDDAVRAFLAMELHVADCARCARNEVAFTAAMDAQDFDETRRLSALFCDDMKALAEELTAAGLRATG